MSHAPTRWSIKGAVFAASLAVVFAACSGSTASPSASRLPLGARPAAAMSTEPRVTRRPVTPPAALRRTRAT